MVEQARDFLGGSSRGFRFRVFGVLNCPKYHQLLRRYKGHIKFVRELLDLGLCGKLVHFDWYGYGRSYTTNYYFKEVMVRKNMTILVWDFNDPFFETQINVTIRVLLTIRCGVGQSNNLGDTCRS